MKTAEELAEVLRWILVTAFSNPDEQEMEPHAWLTDIAHPLYSHWDGAESPLTRWATHAKSLATSGAMSLAELAELTGVELLPEQEMCPTTAELLEPMLGIEEMRGISEIDIIRWSLIYLSCTMTIMHEAAPQTGHAQSELAQFPLGRTVAEAKKVLTEKPLLFSNFVLLDAIAGGTAIACGRSVPDVANYLRLVVAPCPNTESGEQLH